MGQSKAAILTRCREEKGRIIGATHSGSPLTAMLSYNDEMFLSDVLMTYPQHSARYSVLYEYGNLKRVDYLNDVPSDETESFWYTTLYEPSQESLTKEKALLYPFHPFYPNIFARSALGSYLGKPTNNLVGKHSTTTKDFTEPLVTYEYIKDVDGKITTVRHSDVNSVSVKRINHTCD